MKIIGKRCFKYILKLSNNEYKLNANIVASTIKIEGTHIAHFQFKFLNKYCIKKINIV